jgi:hypothetical protein
VRMPGGQSLSGGPLFPKDATQLRVSLRRNISGAGGMVAGQSWCTGCSHKGSPELWLLGRKMAQAPSKERLGTAPSPRAPV